MDRESIRGKQQKWSTLATAKSLSVVLGVKMLPISFSIQKDKLLSGDKKQTIRERKTDHWLRSKGDRRLRSKGDRIRVWWKQRSKENELLFESELSEDPFVIKWRDFNKELMIKDGFKSVEEANRLWFVPQCGEHGDIVPDKEFVVLRWKQPRRCSQSKCKLLTSQIGVKLKFRCSSCYYSNSAERLPPQEFC